MTCIFRLTAFFTFFTNKQTKKDFKTLYKISFCSVFKWTRLLIKLTKKSINQPAGCQHYSSSSVFVRVIKTHPFFCLFGVFSTDDSCKQTSLTPSKHPCERQGARTHAKTWQQAVAPPGGNKDLTYAVVATAEIPPHGVNSLLSWTQQNQNSLYHRTFVFSADLTFCFNLWLPRKQEN